MDEKDMEKAVSKGKIVLLVMPSDVYYEEMKKLMRVLSKRFKNICYISLNRPHNILARAFREYGIDVKRIFFIDAVSKQPEPDIKVLLIPSPRSLMELDTGIEEIIMGMGADCFVFDSLSTILLYGDSLVLTKFFHVLSLKLRSINASAFFTALEKHVSSNLISDISMFADSVVRVDREL